MESRDDNHGTEKNLRGSRQRGLGHGGLPDSKRGDTEYRHRTRAWGNRELKP